MTEVLDKAELLEEIDGDVEFLNESFAMLEKDAPALLASIRIGLASGDADVVWKNAHTMKSMVGNFYALSCYDAAYAVETQGRQGHRDGMVATVDTLEAEVAKLLAALRNVLNELS